MAASLTNVFRRQALADFIATTLTGDVEVGLVTDTNFVGNPQQTADTITPATFGGSSNQAGTLFDISDDGNGNSFVELQSLSFNWANGDAETVTGYAIYQTSTGNLIGAESITPVTMDNIYAQCNVYPRIYLPAVPEA